MSCLAQWQAAQLEITILWGSQDQSCTLQLHLKPAHLNICHVITLCQLQWNVFCFVRRCLLCRRTLDYYGNPSGYLIFINRIKIILVLHLWIGIYHNIVQVHTNVLNNFYFCFFDLRCFAHTMLSVMSQNPDFLIRICHTIILFTDFNLRYNERS